MPDAERYPWKGRITWEPTVECGVEDCTGIDHPPKTGTVASLRRLGWRYKRALHPDGRPVGWVCPEHAA